MKRKGEKEKRNKAKRKKKEKRKKETKKKGGRRLNNFAMFANFVTFPQKQYINMPFIGSIYKSAIFIGRHRTKAVKSEPD